MTTLRITQCPTFGSGRIKRVRRNWTDTFEGETYTVPDMEFHQCPDCGEELYDR